MKEVASYIRIVDADPSNELVANRTSAVKELAAQFVKSKDSKELLAIANNLVEALNDGTHVPEALATTLEAAIQKFAVAFVRDGKELEMLVCGLLGALNVFDARRPQTGAVQKNDILAIGLWTGLSFQAPRKEPKLEELRELLLTRVKAYANSAGHRTRVRTSVQDVSLAELKNLDEDTLKFVWDKGIKPTIDALRNNAVIDREELDLLWWTLAGWSSALDRPLDQKGVAVANGIAAGLEVGQRLRGFPLDAHKHLVLRFVKGASKYSLPELLNALGEERESLGEYLEDDTIVEANPSLFPLCEALRTGVVSNEVNGSQKRSLADWSVRALVEAAGLHLATNAPRVLV